MGKVRKRIWWIAIPALLAVLLFQLYWLRQTYRSQQEAFVATATEAFLNVYDNAIIVTAKIKSGGKHKDKKYTIQAMIDVDKSSKEEQEAPGPRAFISYDSTMERSKSGIPEDIHLDTSIANTNMSFDTMSPLAHFVSTVFSSFTDVMPDVDTLNKYYRRELDKKHITLPFRILIGKEIDTTVSRPTLMIYPGMNNPKKTIGVQFGGLNTYLLKKMGSAVILSIFIAFLIIGCIWTLWRIIVRQEKLESMKREFISHVTHELKTPVSILKATNEALLTFRGINDPDKTERYLRHSKVELDKLQDLIDKIMQVTREEQEQHPLSVVSTNLKTLMNDAVIRFSHLPGVSIRQQYDIQSGHFQTDITAFNTILSNLLDNAVKYNDKSQKEILVSVREHTGYYSFTVKDNGNGIEKQHLPFLFDKFYRVVQGDRHDTKGYGLGLSHVKALLHQLHGSISVSSNPGNGTTFIFQLPKDEKDQAVTG